MTFNSGDDLMSIWAKKITVEEFNQLSQHSIEKHLGIELVEVGDDFLVATMPVDHRTRQPFGILHGGASVVLAESLGSVASFLTLKSDRFYSVGIEVNANHIRSVTEGTVRGEVRPLHLGKRIHVWEIKITTSPGKLVCVCRLTVAVLEKKA